MQCVLGIIVLVAITSVGIAGSKSTYRDVDIEGQSLHPVTGLTREDILAVPEADDAKAASLILSSVPKSKGFLAARLPEIVPNDFGQADYGWPLRWVRYYSFTRLDSVGNVTNSKQFARSAPVHLGQGSIAVVLGHWAGVQKRVFLWLDGRLFVVLGTVWLAGSLTSQLHRHAIRRRANRRDKAGLCVACGYPLVEMSPGPEPRAGQHVENLCAT